MLKSFIPSGMVSGAEDLGKELGLDEVMTWRPHGETGAFMGG